MSDQQKTFTQIHNRTIVVRKKMAAKKTKANKANKKSTSRSTPVKKKAAKRASVKRKATAKPAAEKAKVVAESSSTKSVKRRAAAKKKLAKTRTTKSTPKSVDGILKTFDKERVTQQAQLTSLQKQIKSLTAKIKSSETQLSKLQKKNIETQHAIATLDARRDAEIGKLLSSMGINLDSAANAAEAAKKKKVDKPTPLFDQALNKPKSDQKAAKKKSTEGKPTEPPAGDKTK